VYAPKLAAHLENINKCSSEEGDAVQACYARESKVAVNTYVEFLEAVREENDEAADKIDGLYRSECLSAGTEAPPTTVASVQEATEDTLVELDIFDADRTVDYVEILGCSIALAETVTTEYELTSVWESYEPRLGLHLENVTRCASEEGDEAVQACYERESKVAIQTYEEFLEAVREVNDEAADKIESLYRSECLFAGTEAPPTTVASVQEATEDTLVEVDIFEADSTVDYVGILECSIEVGETTTTEYELNTIWESYAPRLAAHLENITKCSSEEGDEAVQACHDRESKVAIQTYEEFLEAVREENDEAADKIDRLYRSECLSPGTEAPPTTEAQIEERTPEQY